MTGMSRRAGNVKTGALITAAKKSGTGAVLLTVIGGRWR
jgi:hypothetical protein